MITAIHSVAHLISRRLESERGATAVEYGLMVALIAVVIIGSVIFLGNVLDASFDATGTAIDAANQEAGGADD